MVVDELVIHWLHVQGLLLCVSVKGKKTFISYLKWNYIIIKKYGFLRWARDLVKCQETETVTRKITWPVRPQWGHCNEFNYLHIWVSHAHFVCAFFTWNALPLSQLWVLNDWNGTTSCNDLPKKEALRDDPNYSLIEAFLSRLSKEIVFSLLESIKTHSVLLGNKSWVPFTISMWVKTSSTPVDPVVGGTVEQWHVRK